MNEPWFDPNYAWIPGTLLGTSCGIFGALAGFLIPQGKAKGLITTLYWTMLSLSAVMLAVAVVAFASHQPYGVWYGLGLAGFIGVGVLGANYYTVAAGYRQAELRRMQAQNLH